MALRPRTISSTSDPSSGRGNRLGAPYARKGEFDDQKPQTYWIAKAGFIRYNWREVGEPIKFTPRQAKNYLRRGQLSESPPEMPQEAEVPAKAPKAKKSKKGSDEAPQGEE